MLNIIKADLYRITRPRGLRGSFWQYLTAIVVVFLAVFGVFWFLSSPFMASTGLENMTMNTWFTSPTGYLATMLGSILPLCVSFMVVELALADFKEGFVKSIVTARQGRLSYIGGRIVVAGAISALMIAISSAIVLVLGAISGYEFAQADSVPGAIAWALGFWLNIWAIAMLSLILVYATRVNPVSYIGAWCICVSLVPQLLNGIAASSGGIIRVLAPIAPVLREIACWMPSSALNALAEGATALGAPASGMLANILPGGLAIQALITGIAWIVAGGALVTVIVRTRDI